MKGIRFGPGVGIKKRIGHPEDDIQRDLVSRARGSASKFPELTLLHAIPNGGRRDAREMVRLKAQGLLPGVWDLFLPVARGGYHGLYLETKTPGAHLTELQEEFGSKVQRQGYLIRVYSNWESGFQILERYLTGQLQSDYSDLKKTQNDGNNPKS